MKRERKTEDIVNAIAICATDMEATRKTILEKANLVIGRLEKDKIKVDTSELIKAIEQGAKLLEWKAEQVNEKRDNLLFYWRNMAFCGVFCLVGLASLFFAYKYGFQSKQEYRKSIEQENYLISKEDHPKIKDFMQSNYINDLYNAYLNGEINDISLTERFKPVKKKGTKEQPKEKDLGESFWDELKKLF